MAHTNHLILAASTRLLGPSGFSPGQIASAYGVPGGAGQGAIAVVDAFHDPTALNDFNVFSNQFLLPTEPSSNPTASSNAVFQVVYANGSQPSVDTNWAQEEALDTEWAHALAPAAKVYLVEAPSALLSDLMSAVAVARALPGVTQVSMSFGVGESACDFATYDGTFLHSGVTFFGAGGDTSDEKDFPALSQNVVAVGGTSLTLTVRGKWQSETAWKSGGGGPSTAEPRPLFQDPEWRLVGAFRGACDIAADADPNTGISVYDSTADSQGHVGWLVIGGTSASTVIIASIANASGTARASSFDLNTSFYSKIGTSSFHDITSGTSGTFSTGTGWDFLTGVGTPNGTSGF